MYILIRSAIATSSLPRSLCRALSSVFLYTIIATVLLPVLTSAQIPGIDAKKEAPPSQETLALPANDEAIQKAVEQIEVRLNSIRSLEGTQTDVPADKTTMPSASPDELRKRRHQLSEIAVILDAHAASLRDLKNVRQKNRELTAEIQSWEGFSEKPPFPISFVDGLRDAIAAQKSDIQTMNLRLSILKGELNKYIKSLNESRTQLRLREEQLEKSIKTAKEGRQRWLRDIARLQNELNEAAVASFETRRLIAEEYLSGKNDYLRFLEQKLRSAEQVSPLLKADIDQKLQTLDAQRKLITAELALAVRKEPEISKAVSAYRERLDALLLKTRQEKSSPLTQHQEIARVQSSLDLQTVLADANRERVEVLKAMGQLIGYSETLWEDRFWLTTNPSLGAIREKTADAGTMLDNLRLWKSVVQSRILMLAGLVQSQRAKLDSRERPANLCTNDLLILKAYEERHALLQRAADLLAATDRLASHFSEELAEHRDRSSLQGRLQDAASTIYGHAKKLWLTELYVAEEIVVVEGAKVVKPVSVTIAKAVQALLILIVGVWIARKLMRPLRWIVVHKFKQERSVAAQIGTVAFLVLFVVVFVFSLVSVNIPLAVFAFLGGALAIGIGFGAQNLINNFISGIILLFDRSISVGDLIEVDGQGGKVTAIGMRSSLVQRFDGVEMLVPNSQFLQQKVINWTHSERQMRYSISVGVAYGSPVRKVKELLMQVIEEQEAVLKTPHPLVILDDFADNCLHFTAYFWLELDSLRDNRMIVSEMRFRIVELFDEQGIVIPFPQRDLHLDASAPIPVHVVSHQHESTINPKDSSPQ